MNFPTQARVVIVGGGIIGCSTAYHLSMLGWRDVILLEQAKLTSGSTHHAAGLVGQLRTAASITQLLSYSVGLYQELETQTGQATGWKMNGGLRLACNPARLTEIKRQVTTARSFGLPMELLTPSEAQHLWPLMTTDDVVGAAYLPTDGQVNPADLCLALAKGARANGVQIFEDCAVDEVLINRDRVSGVVTTLGTVSCEVVVNCCGQWARAFAAKSAVNVPLVSVQHQYLITERIEGVGSDLPTLRDPDRLTYFKEEVGGLVMGGYETKPLAWGQTGIPKNFHFSLLDSNWEQFESIMALAIPRVPALETAGVKQLINGPESFTPDGNFILGEAPNLKGYYVGAGFNAFGIASAGGAGRALAEWIVGGEAPYDLWPVDIRRFGSNHYATPWVRNRTLEMYGKHYTMAWPFEEHSSGRPLRCSPLYARLRDANACFGEKLGWERANWFAPQGVEARDQYSFGRQNWFKHVGEEHRAVREQVGIFDQSSFAKYWIIGDRAEDALSQLCANQIRVPNNTVVYTQMLNQRGGIECDLTVARLQHDQFYLVSGTGFATHDFAWIQRNLDPQLKAKIIDVTSSYGVLSVFGPDSRKLLQQLSDADWSDKHCPYRCLIQTTLANAPLIAMRISYVGELGWELHIPCEYMAQVYAAMTELKPQIGWRNCGYRAIESLRLEKGYLAWGSDLNPDTTPLEAGLGWAVKLHSDEQFIGREALLQQSQRPLNKRLAYFSTSPEIVLLGRETIVRNGKPVGWLSSSGFGYTVNRSIGVGYVRNPKGVDHRYLLEGHYELEVAAERVPAKLHLRPMI